MGIAPRGIAIAPNNLSAIVSSNGNSTVVPLDLTNPLIPVAQLPVIVPNGPMIIAISPNGLFAILTDNGASQLSSLDLANPLVPVVYGPFVTNISPNGMAISPNGLFAIVANYSVGDGAITPQDLTNPLAPVNQFQVDLGGATSGSVNVSISPNGRFALITNQNTNNVTPLDLSNPLVPVPKTPVGVGTTPISLGKTIYYRKP